MPQTFHRKKRGKKAPSKIGRIVIAVLLGAAILAAIVFLLVSVFGQKSEEQAVVDSVKTESPAPTESTDDYSRPVKNSPIQTTEESLDEALYSALAKIGAPKKNLKIRKAGQIEGLGKDLIEIKGDFSRALPMAMANHLIQSAWKSAGGEIVDCVENKLGKQITIHAGFGGITTRRIILVRDQKEPLSGKICLVIDDLGSLPLKDMRALIDIGIPFTASIMPFEPFTEEVYNALVAEDIEIIIHMPMEPEGYPKVDPGDKAIFVDLPPREVRRRIENAIARLPNAVGMNNHMGSKATTDRNTMTAFAEALANSGLFFIDSRTSVYTCAEEEVGKRGIPTTSQDGNIDVVDDTLAIARSFLDLALAAKESESGMLIVGHARPNTIVAIKRVLPTLKKWGVEFVSASEIISHRTTED